MADPEDIPLEDFLRWLAKSFRFGRSVWIIGSQEDMAKAAMVGKSVINERIGSLKEEGYLTDVTSWIDGVISKRRRTYQLTDRGLKEIKSRLPSVKTPRTYEDFTR